MHVQHRRNSQAVASGRPIHRRAACVQGVYDQIVKTFKSDTDQQTLKDAYRELQSENSGGHERLQEMLRKAERLSNARA
jgi:hypothetical protein